MYYWLDFIFSYVAPFTYFFIKLGVTKQVTKIIMPLVLIGLFALIRLAADVPKWVSTWSPSFKKGLVKAIPKLLLFIALITLGLTFKYMIDRFIHQAFNTYFETVTVMFGGMAIGSIFGAFHMKYKELDMIDKGFVLGVVNK